ncbi:hypothetical protein AVEN_268679-1 [Araneus ventricosus]|uniref:Uncharacterized protein n=1 Tax=Araneus ventricosus TaxID=182803 RepID=A0A4Y2V1N6_ARAVE|nr:hypothetical protein AVEN_268679-1 [Araneus ventricosus]
MRCARKNVRYPISGLANTKVGLTRSVMDLVTRSENNNQELGNSVLMLHKPTTPPLPQELKLIDFPHLTIFNLAHLSADVSGQTDLIIRADYFFFTLLQG